MAAHSRLNVNINQETEEALKSLAERHDTTVTTIVRRCVGVYKFLDDKRAENAHIQLVSADETETITLI